MYFYKIFVKEGILSERFLEAKCSLGACFSLNDIYNNHHLPRHTSPSKIHPLGHGFGASSLAFFAAGFLTALGAAFLAGFVAGFGTAVIYQ